MKPYVIKQGDYLLKVAHLLGFDADKVWSDPKNAELKTKRKDPSMLKAGDILFVPDEPKKKLKLNPKQSNTYVAHVPTVKVAVAVAHDNEPLKNKKYVIEGLGDDTEHTTDGDGAIHIEAPVHVREVMVRFVETGMRLQVAIGDLDPPDTPSGARMRLANLGHLAEKLAGSDPHISRDVDALAGAIKKFQSVSGLPITGLLDQMTSDALAKAHGA